jgi:cephalosporin-C deacetylase-like acetyl esterase
MLHDPAPRRSFLELMREQAAALRAGDHPPASLQAWQERRVQLRQRLSQAWGPFPPSPCELQAETLGKLERGDVHIEKIRFQTFPNVWMTANAYVPQRAGKLPAVLNVHGHWKGAKQDPHVQARCLGLAKLGFFALAVDAFGAGERGLGPALGEYHGEMVAGTLWPTGLALAGVQVYENQRAVDYLLTRPEVDGARIGITGASGGGNQSMYAGAWDERLRAVVPVCSVGNYQAYLGVACCMCEVIPGALRFTEEGAVIGLIAPRALLVMNATRDSVQFSVPEAQKSIAQAAPIFQLYQRDKALRHATFDSPHDYNQAMREAMYGWMRLHLAEEGDGSPLPEPMLQLEEPETLRCYPGDSRPATFTTLPQFAASVAHPLARARVEPDHLEFWESEAFLMRESLERLVGGWPLPEELDVEVEERADEPQLVHFTAETLWRSSATYRPGTEKKWVFVVHAEGCEAAARSDVALAFQTQKWHVVCPALRATGADAPPKMAIGRAPDHHAAQWGLWLGRPLAAQWAVDIHRAVAATFAAFPSVPEEMLVVGIGPASVAALLAATIDDRIEQLALVEPLLSFVADVPYQREYMGSLIPGVLPHVGNVAHLASLHAPRRLLIIGGVLADGKPLDVPQIEEQLRFTRHTYKLAGAADKFQLRASLPATQWVPQW